MHGTHSQPAPPLFPPPLPSPHTSPPFLSALSMAPARHRDRSHQAAFRSSVINKLGAGFGNRATWSLSGGMPFLTNLADLADAPPSTG